MQLDNTKPIRLQTKGGEFHIATQKSIVIIDESMVFRRVAEKLLLKAGYLNYRVYSSIDSYALSYKGEFIDLLMIDVDKNPESKFNFIEATDYLNIRHFIPSGEGVHLDVIERSVRAGADDFLVKSRYLNLLQEIDSLVSISPIESLAAPHPSSVFRSCFLRCIGLSEFEIVLLKAFCPTFPSQKELAFQLRRSDSYIRKIFSNIYRKLNVANSAQLANLLTLCSLFGSAKKRYNGPPNLDQDLRLS